MFCEFGYIVIVSSILGPVSENLGPVDTGQAITELKVAVSHFCPFRMAPKRAQGENDGVRCKNHKSLSIFEI